jgi:hypothetical protein
MDIRYRQSRRRWRARQLQLVEPYRLQWVVASPNSRESSDNNTADQQLAQQQQAQQVGQVPRVPAQGKVDRAVAA